MLPLSFTDPICNQQTQEDLDLPQPRELDEVFENLGLNTLLDIDEEEALCVKEGIVRPHWPAVSSTPVGLYPFTKALIHVALHSQKELCHLLFGLLPSTDPVHTQIKILNGQVGSLDKLTSHLNHINTIRSQLRETIKCVEDSEQWKWEFVTLESQLTQPAKVFWNFLVEAAYFLLHDGVYSEQTLLRCSIKTALLEEFFKNIKQINSLQRPECDFLVPATAQLSLGSRHAMLLQAALFLPQLELETLTCHLHNRGRHVRIEGHYRAYLNDTLSFISYCSYYGIPGVKESFIKALEQATKLRSKLTLLGRAKNSP